MNNGLDRTGHMSFLTEQDRTPKFAGQVLLDQTKSGLIYIFKHFTYQVRVINSLKIRFMETNLVSKVLNWDVFENSTDKQKTIERKLDFFLSIPKSVKSPVSGKANVQGFRTVLILKTFWSSGQDMMSSSALF